MNNAPTDLTTTRNMLLDVLCPRTLSSKKYVLQKDNAVKHCRYCDVALSDENWGAGLKKLNSYRCSQCHLMAQLRSLCKYIDFDKLAATVAGHFQDREKEAWARGVHEGIASIETSHGAKIAPLEKRIEGQRAEINKLRGELEAAQSGNGFELLFSMGERIAVLENDKAALEKSRDSFESGTLMGIQRFGAAERRVKELEAELAAARGDKR